MRDVTVITKTMFRPQSLIRLVRSVRHFYPDSPILVGNDQNEDNPLRDTPVWKDGYNRIIYHYLPHDCGLSAGRNELARHVNTKYTMLVEDDFEFISATRIDYLKQCLDELNLDIVAGWLIITNESWRIGQVQRHEGLMRIEGKTLFCEKNHHREHRLLTPEGRAIQCREVDIVLNFFLAKTEALEQVTWDEQFKNGGEHQDFFLRIKNILKVGVCPQVIALHYPHMTPDYLPHKQKGLDQQRTFLEKHGLQEIQFTPAEAWL